MISTKSKLYISTSALLLPLEVREDSYDPSLWRGGRERYAPLVVARLHFSRLINKSDIPLDEQDVAIVARNDHCGYAGAIPTPSTALTALASVRWSGWVGPDNDWLYTSRLEQILSRSHRGSRAV